MLIVNTGGTFNKIYDPISGELLVARNDRAVKSALEPFARTLKYSITGTIYKDSLEMDDHDREELSRLINRSKERQIVVVHGTDTMNRSASFVASKLPKEKVVIFTGAMIPYSIDRLEAALNLSSAVTAAALSAPGVYIAMHGMVLPHERIAKNRTLGIFEEVRI